MRPIDLNRLEGDGYPGQRDHGCISGQVEVVFRDHQGRLLRLFEEAQAKDLVCLGAVAWLTDPAVLEAMAKLPTAVVVQKEDFLRPDSAAIHDRKRWKVQLRSLYDAIACSGRHCDLFIRQNFPDPLGALYLVGDQSIAGVRCVGLRNDRVASGVRHPLMHNKFLVFARLRFVPEHDEEKDEPLWDPQIVWTGSYNLSRMAHRSRENTVVIRNPTVASAYLHEWVDLMSLSEPLDWGSDWVDPQWHEGS
jgi:hypothetical protein